MTEQLSDILDEYAQVPGPLLLVLHAVQRRLGFVPRRRSPVHCRALESLAGRSARRGHLLSLLPARRARPPRGASLSCRILPGDGSGASGAHAEQRLGTQFHDTTPDGKFSLEPVYCLGNCACSPAIMIDGELHGRVSTERFDALIGALDSDR